ncbi:MAG: glycosyltransferase [Trueperaceae bacterium]|nr:glycosyltransferase [Trueperaceae bacterium]
MKRQKLLFATMQAGGGHVATAHAMKQAIEEAYPGQFDMSIADYLDEVGATQLDKRNKDAWRFALRYPVTARLGQRAIDLWPQLSIRIQRLIVQEFAELAAQHIEKEHPDIIISNYGLVSTGLALAKKRYHLDVPVITFATETHNICAYWADPWADHVIVPNNDLKQQLVRMGMPEDKLSVVGYPVQQSFLYPKQKEEARRILDLPSGFTCLLSLGGEGVATKSEQMLNTLLDIPGLDNIIVICGRNQDLKDNLEAQGNPRLQVKGFVTNMADYIAASDLVIGKAGPASVYETLAVGRPMIITSYAGLNELGVLDFVVDKGLGAYARSAKDLKAHLEFYIQHPEQLERVRKRCKKLKLAKQTRSMGDALVRFANQDKVKTQRRYPVSKQVPLLSQV